MARRATPNITAGSDVMSSEKGMESMGAAPTVHPGIAQSRQTGGIRPLEMPNDNTTKVVMANGSRQSFID